MPSAAAAPCSPSSSATTSCRLAATQPSLQRVYEIAAGEALDPSSFRRKMLELQMIEPVALENMPPVRGRPPQYYRLANRTLRAFQRKI